MSKRYQQLGKALGSEVILTLVSNRSQNEVDIAFRQLWKRISKFEQRFSRFLPTSELTALNQANGKRFYASQPLIRIIKVAKNLSETTGGLFNPLILPALQTAGYVGSWPQPTKAGNAPIYTSRSVATASAIKLGQGWIELPQGGAIDLGGIGKGRLLDQLANYLSRRHYHDFWLSLGGDIIVQGKDINDQPWSIGLPYPDQQVSNATGKRLAIATSGITKRRGVSRQGSWHHIIDPRTQKPAKSDLAVATVCHPRATAADVYAKCLVVLGTKAARQFSAIKRIPSVVMQTLEGKTISLPRAV